MIKRKVYLNEVTKVYEFVNTVGKYETDVDMVSGRYVIDAKSIMGIFGMDLSKPIEILIHADENDEKVKEELNKLEKFFI